MCYNTFRTHESDPIPQCKTLATYKSHVIQCCDTEWYLFSETSTLWQATHPHAGKLLICMCVACESCILQLTISPASTPVSCVRVQPTYLSKSHSSIYHRMSLCTIVQHLDAPPHIVTYWQLIYQLSRCLFNQVIFST